MPGRVDSDGREELAGLAGAPSSAEARRERTEPLGRVDDEVLIRRFENGDQRAFEVLFQRHREPLFRFILRFLRDEEASQDALQDVFLKVIRDPSRFQARSRFSTWLHAVARNLCLDLLRKRKWRAHALVHEASERVQRPLPGPVPVDRIAAHQRPTDVEAGRRPLRLKLLVAIRAIPADQRRVFLLREVAGLGFADIASSLSIPLNTAKSRMRYALINLRRMLTKLGVSRDDLLPG